MPRLLCILVVLMPLVACGETVLEPGRCKVDSDCLDGLVCVQDEVPGRWHRCEVRSTSDGGGLDAIPDLGIADSSHDGSPLTEVGGGDIKVAECASSSACTGTRPVCDVANGVCVACTSNPQCEGRGGAAPFCEVSTGRCVACVQHSQCPEAMPACANGSCVACNAPGATAQACGTRDAAKAVCAADSGRCVECNVGSECGSLTKPICEQHACRKCAADAECVSKIGADPGVCMAHDDGRCATSAETVFVENVTARCMNTAAAGTAAVPYCGLQEGVTAAKGAGKTLVVLRGAKAVFGAAYNGPGKLALVGQAGALIRGGAGPGISVSGGEAYVRGIVFEASDPGVSVASNGKLLMESCMVRDNPGGGALVNAGTLVLRNTTVSGNGPGQQGATTWGGLLFLTPEAGTRLDRVSVVNNKTTGISCSSSIQSSGVLATGNLGVDVALPCGFTSCATAGPVCGAQP